MEELYKPKLSLSSGIAITSPLVSNRLPSWRLWEEPIFTLCLAHSLVGKKIPAKTIFYPVALSLCPL